MTYVGGFGDERAQIMFVGEAIGVEEESLGRAFVGASGRELMEMVREAGIKPETCWFTNVIRERPRTTWGGRLDLSAWITSKEKEKSGKIPFFGHYVSDKFLEHRQHLLQEILLLRPKVIVALGNLALLALTGNDGVTKWRGSELWLDLPDIPYQCHVVPTFNPAFIFGNWPARRLMVCDIKRAKRCVDLPKYEFVFPHKIRPTFDEAREFLLSLRQRLANGPVLIACDIETRFRQIDCVGLSTEDGPAFCIPIFGNEKPQGYFSREEEALIIHLLREVLTHKNARVVGQNFHYDDSYFAKCWGFRCNVAHDVMIEWHVLFPRLEKSLAFICSLIADRYVYWKDDNKEVDGRVPDEQRWIYNCTDVWRTLEAHKKIQETARTLGLEKQCAFEMSLYDPVLKMILRGVRQDRVIKEQTARELEEEIRKRTQWLESVCGFPLNPSSHTQMKSWFYDVLRQKRIYNRRTGEVTVDDAALEKIADREPLLRQPIRIIQQIRSLRVFKSTFTEARIDEDGRLRSHFWIPGTNTFRFSSKRDPFGMGANLQNIPKGSSIEILDILRQNGEMSIEDLAAAKKTSPDEILSLLTSQDEERKGLVEQGFVSLSNGRVKLLFSLPNIRKFFIPDPGYVWVACDLKGADFQVMVWEAQLDNIKSLLRAGLDVHTELAKITKLPRDKSKQLIHATDYKAQPKKIAEALGLSLHQAERAQKAYLDFAPGVKEYHRRVEDSVRRKGFVENAFGFRCYFFERPEEVITKALAWIPQSTVALTINAGIVNVDKNLPEFELLLQVHDEADFQIRDGLLDTFMPKLDEQMRIVIPYDDPLVIPLEYKISRKSWGELEKWKP